jgi:S1-C subfamily serine protease
VDVTADSEAEKAGVRGGDLILEINGRRAVEAGDFLARLAASAAIQETRLDIRRGTEILESTLPELDLR